MYRAENEEAAYAISQNAILLAMQGFGTVGDVCEVTVNTGTLGAGNGALEITAGNAGDVLAGGTAHTVGAQTIDIDTGGSQPRVDLIYVDTNGDVQVSNGIESDSSGPADPYPDDLDGGEGTPLAAVIVEALATSIEVNGLADYRVSAQFILDRLQANTLDAGSVNTKTLGTGRHYADVYDGSDPDARLDAALSASSSGDTIYLENGVYDGSHTISKDLTLVGTGQNQEGTTIAGGTWTFDGTVTLNQIGRIASDPSLTFNQFRSYISNSYLFLGAPTITVTANEFRFINNRGGEVVFESGTDKGIVDGCTNTSTIDNGNNTVGDVA